MAARKGRIGGSDIGVICGWSKFKTAADLADEKLGLTEATPTSKAQERGIYCEPAIKAWVADTEGLTWDSAWNGTWVSDDDDRFMYNPDAVSLTGVLGEFKTCAVRDSDHGWGRAGTDAVPLAYAAQTQWGMGLLGLQRAVVGVLAGAPKFEFARYRIAFDQQVFDHLRRKADQFLNSLTRQDAA
jgi:predicted phage-related endonuclease